MRPLMPVTLLLIALCATPLMAQDDLSPELAAQMDELEVFTRDVRGLDGETVARAFPSRDEAIAYFRDTLDEQLPVDEARRYLAFYAAFDLMPPDTDLRTVYLDLLSAQVAGYYDTDTQVMNVIPLAGAVGDELGLTEQIIYVHEYTHALQDQFFDLDALTESLMNEDEPDRALAITALIEGDATLVMQRYVEALVNANPLSAFQLLGEAAAAGSLNLPEETPPVLSRELLFPYEGGLTFVTALYADGGWAAVDTAFANLPASSEHILHPQTYLDGDQPIAVTLGDSAETLGDDWRVRWDITLGEWYLREHLNAHIPADADIDASTAAAGWGGDRTRIYQQDESGALAWTLRLAWDTPADAAEFATAYTAWGDARFGASAEAGCWVGADDTVCLTEVEGETLIALAPTLAQAQALLAANGG